MQGSRRRSASRLGRRPLIKRMATRVPLQGDAESRVLSHVRGCWKNPRNRCLIEFGLRTGFRASEISALRIADVWNGTDVRAAVTLARRFLKNGRGVHRAAVRSRTVPLSEATRSVVRDYIEHRRAREGALDPDSPLFKSTQSPGRGIGRWMINVLVKRACAQAGLPQHGRWGSHTLRKSFAHRVYEASGHDINLTRAALAHRDIATTQRYLTVCEEELQATIRRIG